jgi:uncharacterized protein YkwD
MKTFVLIISMVMLGLTSCSLSISAPEQVVTRPFFMTATLPSTRTPYAGPVATATPEAPTLSITAVANCKDSAILLQDVTIADGTNVPRGSNFTKTWQFKNSGDCPWTGYSIAFVSGDRMGSLDSAPIPPTPSKQTVNVSMDLTAPTNDGIYTGFFELRNALGTAVPIGIEKDFWVKIVVGNAIVQPVVLATPVGTASYNPTAPASHGPLSCKYTPSSSYPNQVANLINTARQQAGLQKLTISFQLAAAAQGHSIDMACNGLLSHTGSDASTIYQRMVAAGYTPIHYLEIIWGGGYPQNALDGWMGDQVHHDAILSASVKEMGVGYAYIANTAAGGYYTVDFGSR